MALYRNLKGGRAYERKDYRDIETDRFNNTDGSIYGVYTMVDCRFRIVYIQFLCLKVGPYMGSSFSPHFLHSI